MMPWRDMAYFAALSVVDGASACLIAWAWLKVRRRQWRIAAIGVALLLIAGGDWLLRRELGK